MTTYTLSQSITAAQLADADDADVLIANVEGAVIAQLGGPRDGEPVAGEQSTPRGEIKTEWFAVTPGVSGGDDGEDRPTESEPWNPTDDEVPDGADILVCQGTRTT
jgi:hypothetical protein